MRDHTVPTLIAIVAIVLIFALFLRVDSMSSSVRINPTTLVGEATQVPNAGVQTGEVCEPDRFCDGSRLMIIRQDCSLAISHCQFGCDRELAVCR